MRALPAGSRFAASPAFIWVRSRLNYGATVIVTGLLYGSLGVGTSAEMALAICLAVAVLLPVVLFRHAHSLLLALGSSVNSRQAGTARPEQGSGASAGGAVPSARELRDESAAAEASIVPASRSRGVAEGRRDPGPR